MTALQNKTLKVIERETSRAANQADLIIIKNNEDLSRAKSVLLVIKEAQNTLKAEKEKILGPQLTAIQATRDFFKPYESRLDTSEIIIKAKQLEYGLKVEAEAREKEALIAAKVDEGTLTFEQGAAKIAKLDERAEAKTAGVQFQTQRDIEITNPLEVPIRYFTSKVIEALATAVRSDALAGGNINGVRVVERKIVVAK
jgi:hypothetical protein